MPDTGPQPSVRVTLASIYEQGQQTASKVTELEHAVSRVVAINERLDSHKDDISGHDVRVRKLEIQVAAQWVIVGLVSTAIGALLIKVLTG